MKFSFLRNAHLQDASPEERFKSPAGKVRLIGGPNARKKKAQLEGSVAAVGCSLGPPGMIALHTPPHGFVFSGAAAPLAQLDPAPALCQRQHPGPQLPHGWSQLPQG